MMHRNVKTIDTRQPRSRKQKPVSYLPVLLLVIFGQVIRVTLLIRKRSSASFAAVDPTNMITILLLILGLLLLLTPKGGKVFQRAISSPLRFFMLYYILCGSSILWSDEWSFTIFRTVQLLVNTVLMCWIAYEMKDIKTALLALIRFAAIWMLFGILGRMRLSGFGLFGNDNAASCVAAMGLVMTLGAWKEKIISFQKLIIPGVVFVFGLLSGLSSASNISVIFGVSLVLVGVRHKSALFIQALAAVVVVSIGWSVIQSGAFNKWLMPGKTQAQITSLHGRTDMWKRYYKGIQERPILGYGFPIGEKRARTLEDGTQFGEGSAHNSIVGIAINTGAVGLGIIFLGVAQVLSATNRSIIAGRSGGVTMIAVIATAFLNSMSYPVIGSHWFWPTTVVQGMAGIGLCYVWLPTKRKARKVRKTERLKRRKITNR